MTQMITSCARSFWASFFPTAILALSLALAGMAEAHPGLETAEHSPFAAVKAETPAYCPLDGHPLQQYCPHAVHFEKTHTEVPQIDRDCGGDSSGKIPPKSGFDNKPAFDQLALSIPSDDDRLFYFSIARLIPVFPDSPEQPPKLR